jgi:NAD(P)-dependent dehydrogenase (short-subunit alcohol dehydrogenase family)
LVTGASRGIGAACAVQLAQGGWAVVVNCSSNTAAALTVVDQIKAAGGVAMPVQADVGDEAQVLRMFEQIDAFASSMGGALRGLVNNAGVVDMPAKVQDMSLARLERMWRTNVTSAFVCAREALKRMNALGDAAQGCSIVNIGSAASRLGSPGQYVDYAASKAAIDTFTLGLAREVAAQGIRVNCVRPGIIDTDIHASGGLPDRVAQLAPQVPLQRGGSPQEVAAAVAWLMSDAASYTTGALLDVSGGR